MFTTDSGPSCDSWYQCPKCNCDGRNVGDIWYQEYQNVRDLAANEIKCTKCECKTDAYGNNYADCEYGGSYIYGIDSQSCTLEEEDPWECHIAGSSTSGKFYSFSFVFR